MPIVNGRHYANPGHGAAMERSRLAQSFREFRSPQKGQPESWAKRLVGHLTKPHEATAAPPHPRPPGMPAEAYDHMKINEMTVRQVANVVANENRDVTPGKSSHEELRRAKNAQAHAVINADRRFGRERTLNVRTAPDTVTAALENSGQYKEALHAARSAFEEQLSGKDAVGGRMWFNNRPIDSTGERKVGREKVNVYKAFGPFQHGKDTVYIDIDENLRRTGEGAAKK